MSSTPYVRWVLESKPQSTHKVIEQYLRLVKAQRRFRERIKKQFPIGSEVRFWHGGVQGRELIGQVAFYCADDSGLCIRFPEGVEVPQFMRLVNNPGVGFVEWENIGGCPIGKEGVTRGSGQ